MTGYIDTSVLVAYYCPEPLSRKAERALIETDQPAISALVEVELVSALGRKIRENTFSQDDANRILDRFRVHLNRPLFSRIALQADHYTIAFQWLSRFLYPLRTLDALHLAVASERNLEMITADRQLSQSANRLGLPCRLLS